jgi:hypothetical protein
MAPPRFEEPRVAPPQHSESQGRVLECRHRIRVHRSRWPPRDKKGNEETPHVDATCVRCGALVLAEDPPQRNLDVILYGDKTEQQGRVLEEQAGRILEESELPPEPMAGTVSDEDAAPRSRGRIRA